MIGFTTKRACKESPNRLQILNSHVRRGFGKVISYKPSRSWSVSPNKLQDHVVAVLFGHLGLMKFLLIDKIEAIEPGQRIVTSKNLSLAEEYLCDHFPSFPVLPGVLMLEAMTQLAAWLVRLQHNYTHSIIVLKVARNVRYNYFLKPGNTLRCEVDTISIEETHARFKGSGFVGDRLAVSARFELKCQNMAEKGAFGRDVDERIIAQLKRNFLLIGGPEALTNCESENR